MRQIRQAQALDFLGMKALDDAATIAEASGATAATAGDVPSASVISKIRSAMTLLATGRLQVTYGPEGDVTDVTDVI